MRVDIFCSEQRRQPPLMWVYSAHPSIGDSNKGIFPELHTYPRVFRESKLVLPAKLVRCSNCASECITKCMNCMFAKASLSYTSHWPESKQCLFVQWLPDHRWRYMDSNGPENPPQMVAQNVDACLSRTSQFTTNEITNAAFFSCMRPTTMEHRSHHLLKIID